jgi:hypothetical protein
VHQVGSFYKKKNVISFFLFTNNERMINQSVTYSQNRKKKVLVTSTRASIIMRTRVNTQVRIKAFLESSHTEITVVPIKTRQPNSAWVDCVLSVQNAERGSDTSVCHSWPWSRSVLLVLTAVSQCLRYSTHKIKIRPVLKEKMGNVWPVY